MDPSPSPRRELQGPRPTPLKVSKESYKIKKPPVAPAPSHPAAPPQPLRPPVVIYAISPKIIHVEPGEFMTLVQRLTGPDSSSAADASLPSPAARIATFESSAPSRAGDPARGYDADPAEMEGWPTLDRTASFPGILSPVPWALPPISPKLFSPSFDPSVFSILQELSPVFGGTFSGSPSNSFLSTPLVPSPGACWDLLSQLPYF
ncbi:hypothetical protein BHM03_00010553 [Ensete ventricosum]|nr:hypothetical protein BHM03_00010553 [Ensete ventricosum]